MLTVIIWYHLGNGERKVSELAQHRAHVPYFQSSAGWIHGAEPTDIEGRLYISYRKFNKGSPDRNSLE